MVNLFCGVPEGVVEEGAIEGVYWGGVFEGGGGFSAFAVGDDVSRGGTEVIVNYETVATWEFFRIFAWAPRLADGGDIGEDDDKAASFVAGVLSAEGYSAYDLAEAHEGERIINSKL